MDNARALRRAAEMLALAALMACGGGNEGDDTTPVDTTPITYVGNTNPAVVTAGNAAAITATVFSNGETPQGASSTSNLAASQLSGVLNIGRHMHRSVRSTTVARNRIFQLGGSLASPCDSGEVRVSGAVGDNGIGTVSIDYKACRSGDTTTNGSASVRIDAFARVPEAGFIGPTDYTITFTRLTLTGVLTASLSGSIHTHLDIPTTTETNTENMVVLFGNGAMAKSEDLVYVDRYVLLAHPPVFHSESVSGRVFHSEHGWVDISTAAPLEFNFSGLEQEFPSRGVLLLNGASSAIRLSALSQTLVDLGLDLDGDGVVERSVLLAWAELNGPVGADLGDTDGDGMHNGWELANSLNPNDASDATADADGDGASNWQEYDALTDARNLSSVPANVGLSINASAYQHPVFGFVEYGLTISITGPLAKNVVVSISPPPSADFLLASLSQGSCAGIAPVVCTLGTVRSNPELPVYLRFYVTPTVEGIITNTATVSTTSFDPVVSDNSVTTILAVSLPNPPSEP
jgi:hypothetical protein